MTEPNPNVPASGSATTAEQSIAVIVEHNPVIVLLDEGKRTALFEHIEKELAEFVPDLTTSAGREEVRKFAAKITRTKTAADKAGLDLTEEARTKIKTINGARTEVKDRLTELATRARQPLTDWEEAEEKRVAWCETVLVDLTSMSVVPLDATAEQVDKAIDVATAYEIDPAKFQGMTEAAIKARNHTIEVLKAALERIRQQEAEREELARLRAEAAARQREEEEKANAAAEAEAAAAAAEQERLAAEYAERERVRLAEEAAAAAAEREAAAAREAEERAQREAQEAAAAEAAERDRQHQAELQAERDRAAAAERAAQAERDRAAAAERAREEERQRTEAAAAAEAQRRAQAEADQAHRQRCKGEIKSVLLTTGITDDQAKAIVLLIVSGELPRVTLEWHADPRVRQPAEAEVEQPELAV